MNFFIAFSLAAGCGAAMNSVIQPGVPLGTGTIACFSSFRFRKRIRVCNDVGTQPSATC
ncbi:hypothetical protein [Bradyrhizobium guangdongense]|uniref:hypothetical protein n=1 Tax=Bradyrhizobium guangdongense TaxID=1325090 RepID=UPI0013E8BB0A|nr:hypothetical protein [Bradyrhizobium guangdongense]